MKKFTAIIKSAVLPVVSPVGCNKNRTVAVIGGGIGGLTAALAFAKQGARVTVFEQAPQISEVGAGIQITPNAARALYGLGLRDGVKAAGLQAHAVQPVDALTGKPIALFDLRGQTPAYRFFHRADLIGLLADAAQSQGVTVSLGARMEQIDPAGTVYTSSGKARFDLVIGADGLHSVTRALCGNPKDQPFFTGQVAWRGIISVPKSDNIAQIWMAPKRHVVTYPLSGRRLNVVAVQERKEWAAEGWNHSDNPENLCAAFADCSVDLQVILAQVQTPRLWGLFRHPVATHWYSDRLALLGDAAHPTLPFLAQGANLAIEDAYVLARCCDRATNLIDGLAAYQTQRRPRVTRAIVAANANAKNYHLSGIQRRVAHMGLKTIGTIAPDAFLKRLSWLYDYDVTA